MDVTASDADRAKAAEVADLEQMIAEYRAEVAANPPPPPSPDEAIASLRDLTACGCAPAWTERGRHENECCKEWREEVDVLADALAAERAAAVADLDAVLHECGIDYPTGLRGVRDLYQLFLGQKDRAEEAEAAVADLRARVEAVAEEWDADHADWCCQRGCPSFNGIHPGAVEFTTEGGIRQIGPDSPCPGECTCYVGPFRDSLRAAVTDTTPQPGPCLWHANRCEELSALCLVDCTPPTPAVTDTTGGTQ